jgi:hypothetical protein
LRVVFEIFHPTITALESYFTLYNRLLSIDSMVALDTIVAIKSYIELYSRTVFPDAALATLPRKISRVTAMETRWRRATPSTSYPCAG